ncbi:MULTISPECIES: vanadium-dependent haloperoxidase [unclassified Mucilaginibacter]|uniref:vanadium-dependent haloperoxidase n=1 Tax=unclassified Mucilaginibacter TaxID=2617802 RepID=UPI002AC91558|nr:MULTISPECIES: vanadium-dependent haloperoxidase [unclassified Mucilaginibacter]MEB0262190.1 vanadium-dependent haloperoxidase [Mucilaginibacter sp. 10I4]MEB0277050.1 vanadium-dependent haloperoxidase [Mucilaginibacter sp. 10B2]MEB0303001.1 vanadium-dependent haloperoxidase [Mucilaginibacter sp. 5C4]WPX25151.1 vanadium-dependent haloperoxidase [Mucilaginibacter sp. 5C4]
MRSHKVLIAAVFCLLAVSCKQKQKIALKSDADVLHENVDQLTQVIIYDVFSPPVASRIYGYTSLAQYEAMRFQNPKYNSIAGQLHGFKAIPQPKKGLKYNFALAATKAFFTVAHKVTFSVDTLKKYEDKVFAMYASNLDDSTFARSVAFGESVGKAVLARAKADNYAKTRGKPRFLGSSDNGKWHPTAPDYLDGVEFCWGTMETFMVKSSSDFTLPPPPPFSEDKNSEYFKQNLAVYEKSKSLTKEEITIATFWDDNPFVIQHNGHMMFVNKKITPGGHWIGIATIACKKTKADAVKTAQAYALTSIALYDAFICGWQVKYTTEYIRPVTVINDKIDHTWLPLLQTPPFPEYPSGHSDISGASAVILTHLFGDNFSYMDTSDLRYIGMQRHFDSFLKAADETSISRFYGGLHYKNSVDQGAAQGRKIGEYIWNNLKLQN